MSSRYRYNVIDFSFAIIFNYYFNNFDNFLMFQKKVNPKKFKPMKEKSKKLFIN